MCPSAQPTMTAATSCTTSDLDAVDADRLFATLYRDLHRMARRQVFVGGDRGAVGPTTLLHEAYLRIAGRDDVAFPDGPHFLAYAARVMRGLMIDAIRRQRAVKRGRQFAITLLDETSIAVPSANVRELTRVSDAL